MQQHSCLNNSSIIYQEGEQLQRVHMQVIADKQHTALADPDTAAIVHHTEGAAHTVAMGMAAEVGPDMPAEGTPEVLGVMAAEVGGSIGAVGEMLGAAAGRHSHSVLEGEPLEACVEEAAGGTVAAWWSTYSLCKQSNVNQP